MTGRSECGIHHGRTRQQLPENVSRTAVMQRFGTILVPLAGTLATTAPLIHCQSMLVIPGMPAMIMCGMIGSMVMGVRCAPPVQHCHGLGRLPAEIRRQDRGQHDQQQQTGKSTERGAHGGEL